MKLEKAQEDAREAVRRGGEKIKARQEASAFGKAHGKSHMYVNVILNSKDPQLSRLLLMADWLGLPAEELLQESKDSSDDTWLRPPRETPSFVKRAQHLFGAAAPTAGRLTRMAPCLEEIDEFRYSNPVQAKQQLHDALETLPPEQIPYALNIAASCSRMLLDLRDGACHAKVGGELAAALDNPLAIGDNLQRWIYLHGNAGNRTTALRYHRRSMDILVEGGSKRKLAETLVDRGYCFYYLADYKRAQRAYSNAGLFSENLSDRNNSAWMQGLAISRLALGDGSGAREITLQAVRIAEAARNELIRGNGLWLLGRIEASLGNLDTAEEYCLTASACLRRHHPLDALLALLEIYSFNRHSRLGVRPQHLDRLAEFLDFFNDLPKIRAILQHLLVIIRLKRLTHATLEGIVDRLETCRPQYYRSRRA